MNRDDLIGRDWEVVEIGGEPVTLERLPTLSFNADGRISGSTGVNRMMGGYELAGDRLSFSQMATTMMAGSPEASKVEANLVQALSGGGEVEAQLVIRNPESGVEVRLRPVSVEPETPPEAPASAPVFTATVRGHVLYRERILMPEGSIIIVRLLDTSRADAPGEIIGEQVIEEPPNVPVAFEIGYDSSAIDQARSYAIDARIEVNGHLAWISDGHHPVLTRGAGDTVEVVLSRARP